MTNIVEQLRTDSFYSATHGDLMRKAADEIERLEFELKAKSYEVEIENPRRPLVVGTSSEECPHCHWGFAPSVIRQHIREKHET